MKHFILFCAFWAALLTSCSAQGDLYTADFDCGITRTNVLLAPYECLASVYTYSNDTVQSYTMSFLDNRSFQLHGDNGFTIYFEHLHDATYRQHVEVLGQSFSAVGTFRPLQ